MAETANVADVARRISHDIFKFFRWRAHGVYDANFPCVNDNHTDASGNPRATHPSDVVFYYDDPYTGCTQFLLTDLKSYKGKTVGKAKLRLALQTLCNSVECARESDGWRQKYSVNTSESTEVRGLLFVHNHDGKNIGSFRSAMAEIDPRSLPVPVGAEIHFLGPEDINRLFSVSNDLLRLRGEGSLPDDYTFYYPDLVLARRHGPIWGQAATFESMMGPFLILKYGKSGGKDQGYLIYYNRPGESHSEFVYFIDCLSRFQLLDAGERIRIRMCGEKVDEDFRSNFEAAKNRYVRDWGFDPGRTESLDSIELDKIAAVTSNYSPGDMGWRK